jgi:multidrug efflux pump subunit AcrA (membrane-fusion protein)
MKNFFVVHGKTMALFGVLLVLVLLLGYVALQAGPLAPVPITVETVQVKALQPALFGMGTVEARVTHKIGPTVAGRIKRVDVQTGDVVKAGQVLGEMDPVDLDDKIAAQEATIKRAQASVMAVEAQVQELTARKAFAEVQSKRYATLLVSQSVSEEGASIKRQELAIASASLAAVLANLDASGQESTRARADRDGLVRQRANLRLISPAAGIVSRRDADAGTTAVVPARRWWKSSSAAVCGSVSGLTSSVHRVWPPSCPRKLSCVRGRARQWPGGWCGWSLMPTR